MSAGVKMLAEAAWCICSSLRPGTEARTWLYW